MPDTYTSQFSGEEIDSALRAAQIISGADTPAELRDKLEIRGDTIPVSATDPTPVSEALTASGGGVNPNLLDNWFFGRPVNQRNGYISLQGVPVYNDAACTSLIGNQIETAVTCIKSGTNYERRINGQGGGFVKASDVVRGYTAVGYTVDRWWTGFDSGNSSLQITNDGVIYNAGSSGDYENFSQPYLKESCVVGQPYTLSFLVDNYQNVNQVFNNKTGSKFNPTENLISYTFTYSSTPDGNPDLGIQFKKGTSTLVKAAKLELGDTQTLAHKENGVWVLNEIPDYGEQLRRCQRYFVRIAQMTLAGWTYSSSIANFSLLLPCAMRTTPSVTRTDGEMNTINGAAAITGMEFKGLSGNVFSVDFHNSANALVSGTPITAHSVLFDISADL